MSDITYPSRPLNSATDSVSVTGTVTAVVSIPSVAIDQTTPGTTNGVQVNAALPAGANTIGAVNQAGTWNVNNVSGTISLPTGAATSAKQPALGTAGTASADVITVQGVTGMTALKVDGSAVTQPVSGTVTVQQGTAANLNATVTGTVAATQSGTWTVQPGNTANTTPWLTTINQGGNSASVTASNALKVDGSAVTQPVSLASAPAPTGRSKVLLYRNDYSTVNVTTSAYVQVTASTSGAINRLYIADTSGSAIILATGAAGAEVDQLYIGPGGSDAPYELNIASSTRISIKALDVSATSGQIIITALS